jgi:hypothetical protein
MEIPILSSLGSLTSLSSLPSLPSLAPVLSTDSTTRVYGDICSRCKNLFTYESTPIKCTNCIELSTIRATMRIARRNAEWNKTFQDSIWASIDAKFQVEKDKVENAKVEKAKVENAKMKNNPGGINTELELRNILNSAQSRKTYSRKFILGVKSKVNSLYPVPNPEPNPICNFGSMIEFPNLH